MSENVQIDRKAFDRALKAFERETGLGGHDVLVSVMRSTLKGAIRAMPPKTTKQGRDAIAADLHKVLGQLDNKTALEKLHESFGARFMPLQFEDNLYAASAHVERFRNSRGRIPPSLEPRTVKAGPYKFDGKMYTTKRNRNAILKAKTKRVGLAKAGFRMAAHKFGHRLPGWIERCGSAPGYGRDTYQPGKPYYYLEAVNAVPHAQRHRALLERQLDSSVYLLRSKLDRILKQTAKKHSAK